MMLLSVCDLWQLDFPMLLVHITTKTNELDYHFWQCTNLTNLNCIGGVMASLLALGVVDFGFKPWSNETKINKLGICCFSAKHTALRSKSWN
jgi:hypothetical protein